MRIIKHAHTIFLFTIVACCLFIAHGCVSSGAVDAAAQEWDTLVSSGKTPTAEQLNHFSDTMNNLSKVGRASMVAAESGDWKTLLAQGLVAVVVAGAGTVANNKYRNATSAQRTAADLEALKTAR